MWNSAENILCIRLDTIGDVLMTTPAIRALKKSHPSRRMTLLTSSAGATTASMVPEIDEVIIYDAPWLKATAPRLNSRPEYEMVEHLRRLKFDGAVIFTVYSQNPLPSAFLCYLADIPLRLAHCHENPYQLLTHWVKDPEPESCMRHEVRRQLDLVATIGCYTDDERMSLHVPEKALATVEDILEKLGINQKRPWVVIHPGATASSRRYPPEKFALVARSLILDLDIQVIFSGTEPERELVRSIQTEMLATDSATDDITDVTDDLTVGLTDKASATSVISSATSATTSVTTSATSATTSVATSATSHSLVGCLNLGELAALLSLAPLLISNNTGPVHIAAAVGTPVVDLYALTNPQHTPWGVPNRVLFHDVPCKYCYKSICPEEHHHCLRLVTPDSVVDAACELLKELVVSG